MLQTLPLPQIIEKSLTLSLKGSSFLSEKEEVELMQMGIKIYGGLLSFESMSISEMVIAQTFPSIVELIDHNVFSLNYFESFNPHDLMALEGKGVLGCEIQQIVRKGNLYKYALWTLSNLACGSEIEKYMDQVFISSHLYSKLLGIALSSQEHLKQCFEMLVGGSIKLEGSEQEVPLT
mmetsp:Transcript_18075/g.30846  ORF Transcript_18075/g.30846 Transcript_18075/m.30846 type:complete len:178 (+) Transcript_18075:1431-1964(+)